jgi:hypothetical protein
MEKLFETRAAFPFLLLWVRLLLPDPLLQLSTAVAHF